MRSIQSICAIALLALVLVNSASFAWWKWCKIRGVPGGLALLVYESPKIPPDNFKAYKGTWNSPPTDRGSSKSR
jgi:hypothetical protein